MLYNTATHRDPQGYLRKAVPDALEQVTLVFQIDQGIYDVDRNDILIDDVAGMWG